MSLDRLRFNYEADPDTLHLPHGPERLRVAYASYLAEEPNPVKYDEGRKRLREWSE